MESKEFNSQIKQTLSITLPIPLYQKLLQEVGKGQISKFIRQTIEERLNLEKESLGLAYQECYSNNPHLLEASQQWEKVQNKDWVNWNNAKRKNK